MKVSIIIVTRNRAFDLVQTLSSMAEVRVPDGLAAELLVVDNGSTDQTAEAVFSARIGAITTRYVREDVTGLSHGRNRGLSETKGEIVMFTDDDLRFPKDWLILMTEPIASGAAEAVCGGVVLAPHLLRPWMSSMHRSWLASTEQLDPREPEMMVGANMAFSRKVLGKVPGFDTELGAGALGSCEETLFSWQIRKAGYRISGKMEASVEHHFQPDRLKRSAWLDAAEKRGASLAYLGHHWEHWRCRLGRVRAMYHSTRLMSWRMMNRERLLDEGCDKEELALAVHAALVRSHVGESRRTRKYECHGLVKLR